ncbi:MAG TPA: nitrate reductase, partial [Cupriavidus sp.]|nr:nitrate reductase [Cupriavidus sp.]
MLPSRSWVPLPLLVLMLVVMLLGVPLARAQGLVDSMRGPTPVANETSPPILFPTENK